MSEALKLAKKYLGKQETAKICRCSTRTLDRYNVLRIGPKRFRLGGKVVYHVDDLREWLERQRNQNGTH